MKKFGSDAVALLGNDLHGSFDPIGIVDIHEGGAEISSGPGLDVVGHEGAGGFPLGPEPNEGNATRARFPEREQQQLLQQIIDGTVDRPAWEGMFGPVSQVEFLQVFAQGHRQKRAQEVIQPGDGRGGAGAPILHIDFALKIGDNLARIEGQVDGAVLGFHLAADVLKGLIGRVSRLACAQISVAGRVFAEEKIPDSDGTALAQGQAHIFFRAAIIPGQATVHFGFGHEAIEDRFLATLREW